MRMSSWVIRDLILDGTDNFETRYLINDYAVSNARPWVYGAAVGSYGISMAVLPLARRRACAAFIRIRRRASQPTCETAGVLGSVTASDCEPASERRRSRFCAVWSRRGRSRPWMCGAARSGK